MARPDARPAREERLARSLLGLVLLLRTGFLLYLFFAVADSFYYYSGDYPTRLLIARDLIRSPGQMLGTIWLPVSFYLNGALLRLWPHAHLAPSLFHILLSGGVLAWVFVIARRVLGGGWAGLAALGWAVLSPMLAKLSLSAGASELEFQFFLLAGAAHWLAYLETRRSRDLWALSFWLALAGGTRHEAWCFMAVPTVWLLSEALPTRRRPPQDPGPATLALAASLMWLPALAWWAAHLREGLFPLLPLDGLLQNVREGALTPDGERWSPWGRGLWMYPAELWSSDPSFLLIAAAGLALTVRSAGARAGRALGAWTAAGLGGLCLTPLLSHTLPLPLERVIVVFQLLLSPFWAAALLAPWRWARRRRWARPLALLPVLLPWVWLAPARGRFLLKDLVRSRPGEKDSNQAAIGLACLSRALGPAAPAPLWEVHLQPPAGEANRTWVHNLARVAEPRTVLDRDLGPYLYGFVGPGATPEEAARRPTVFSLPEGEFQRWCRERGIGLIVTHTPEASRKARTSLRFVKKVGIYDVFSSAEPETQVSWVRRCFQAPPGDGP